ncbi:MAG: hypothetical protein ABEI53_00510 [Candidatus Magasanikbacteria bacterium]
MNNELGIKGKAGLCRNVSQGAEARFLSERIEFSSRETRLSFLAGEKNKPVLARDLPSGEYKQYTKSLSFFS